MTSNQIAAKQAATAETRAREEKRSNRAQERLKQEDQRLKDQQIKQEAATAKAGQILGTIGGFVNSTAKGMGNDPRWYTLDPQLAKDVASFAYGAPLGLPLQAFTNKDETVPGVLSIMYAPTIGSEQAANVAARNIYAYIRHANSGSRNYEATDLLMYMLAIGSAYELLAWAERAYSLALTAKQENRYYSKVMLQASGFDADNVLTNLANFRAQINAYAMQLNAFACPNVMSLFDRRLWMASKIWKDAEIKKSQEYLFVPAGFFVWNPTTAGTQLKYFRTTGSFTKGVTVSNWVAFMKKIVDALLTDEDAGIISGDILKAYTENELFRVGSLPENFHIESEYSPEVLTQIGGAVIMGYITESKSAASPTEWSGLTVAQNGQVIFQGLEDVGISLPMQMPGKTGSLTTTKPSAVAEAGLNQNYVLNMYKDDVTPEDTLVASRLGVCINYQSAEIANDATNQLIIKGGLITGTEVCVGAAMYTLNESIASNAVRMFTSWWILGGDDDPSFISKYSRFDWGPVLLLIAADATQISDAKLLSELQNYAVIDAGNLSRMHYVCALSEYGVPLIGTKVRANAKR